MRKMAQRIVVQDYTKQNSNVVSSRVVLILDPVLLRDDELMEILRCFGHYHNNLRVEGGKGWIIPLHRFDKFQSAMKRMRNRR